MSGNQVGEIIPKWCIRLDSPYPTLAPTDDGYDTEDERSAKRCKSIGTHLFGRYDQSFPGTLKVAYPDVTSQTYSAAIQASPDYQAWIRQNDSGPPPELANKFREQVRSEAAEHTSLGLAASSSASSTPGADAVALPFNPKHHPVYVARQRRLWLSTKSDAARASCTLFLLEELSYLTSDTTTNNNVLYCRCDRRDRLHNTAIAVLKTWLYQLTKQRPELMFEAYSFLTEPDSSFINLEKLTVMWNLFLHSFKTDRPGITYCIIDGLHELDKSDATALLMLLNGRFTFEGCLETGSPLKVLVISHDQPLSGKYGHINIDVQQDGQISANEVGETTITSDTPSDVSDTDDLRACIPVLETLVAYRQPPTLEQFQWFFDEPLTDVKQLVNSCRSFIEVDGARRISFLESSYHHLFSNPAGSLAVHSKLAKRCLDVLRNDFARIDMEVLEENNSLEKKIGVNLAYAIEHWAEHVKLSQDTSVAMLDKLIATFSCNAQTLGKFWLVYTRSLFESSSNKLDWLPHTSILHLFAHFGFDGLLRTATRSTRWDRFKRYLDTPDCLDKEPLSYAILGGHTETVKFFLHGDAEYNSRHVEYAAGTSLEVADLLFMECVRDSLTRLEAHDIMNRAVIGGDVKILKRTIEVLSWVCSDGFPCTLARPLKHAIETGRWELVEPLLAITKLDTNVEDILHYAAMRHEGIFFGNLLDDPRVREAMATHKSDMVNTLSIALEHKCPTMVSLVMTTANLHKKDKNGYNPLQVAARHANAQTMLCFLHHDFSFNNKTIEEGVALNLMLHAAGTHIDPKYLSLILQRGARIRYEHFGITALHVAAEIGRTRTMKILLQHLSMAEVKADIERQCTSKHAEQGRVDFTPLAIAVTRGFAGIVILLVDAGARVDGKVGGRTLVEVAEEAGWEEIVGVLRGEKKSKADGKGKKGRKR